MHTLFSLTSHGRRLGFVHLVLRDLVKIGKPRGIRTVLSLQEDEVGRMSSAANDLIVRGDVELITVKRDYGPATKLIPCHMEYPHASLIVVDDDILVSEQAVDSILKYRNDYPRSVLGFRARTIEIENGKLRPFIGFVRSGNDKYSTQLRTGLEFSVPTRLDDVFFEHVGVVSYPSDYANLAEDEWRSVVSGAPQDDDVAMQVVNIRNGFDTVILPGYGTREYLGTISTVIGGEALYSTSGNGARTAAAMKRFEADFVAYIGKNNVNQNSIAAKQTGEIKKGENK